MQREASWEVRRPALLRVGKICCSLAWRWVWWHSPAGIFLHLNRPRSARVGFFFAVTSGGSFLGSALSRPQLGIFQLLED